MFDLVTFDLCVLVSSVYLEDSFIKSGVFSVAELVRVARSKLTFSDWSGLRGGGAAESSLRQAPPPLSAATFISSPLKGQ